jgi:hypothetical protein
MALKRTSTIISFRFYNFSFEYLSRLHKKTNPTSCLFGSGFVKNPFFLLAGALLFDEKTRQSAALFWFGLRDVGILQYSTHAP